MFDTMLAILADEEKRQGKFIPRAEALKLARELEPEVYYDLGLDGLFNFTQLWNRWVKVRKYQEEW